MRLVPAVVAIMIGSASVSFGQWNRGAAYGMWGGGGNFATSGAQAYDQGVSSILRAQGQKNVDDSQAAINFAQARQQDAIAREQQVQSYFERRKIHDAWFAEQEAKKFHPSHADQVHYAEEGLPKQLTASQLIPATGQIIWPDVLMVDDFTENRNKLQALYTERAQSGGGIGTNNHMAITKEITNFGNALRPFIQKWDTADYMAAKNFITSLGWTGRYPSH